MTSPAALAIAWSLEPVPVLERTDLLAGPVVDALRALPAELAAG